MCDFENPDNCIHAAQAEREVIAEALKELAYHYRKLQETTTSETRAIKLLGAIMALEDAIHTIESLNNDI